MDMLLYAILNKKIKNSGGGGSIDLSDYAKKSEVEEAVAYAHTHENKETLDGITAEKIDVWDAASESIGDIQTALSEIVEV